jgi:hypothetical protein
MKAALVFTGSHRKCREALEKLDFENAGRQESPLMPSVAENAEGRRERPMMPSYDAIVFSSIPLCI